MNTNKRHFEIISSMCFLYLLMCIMISSCSSSTGPSSSDSPDSDALVSGQIDAAGGEITHDEIQLSIPAHAFSGSSAISISESNEPFDEDAPISGTYTLSGIPGDFAEPLTVRLRYTGTLSHESFIAVGNMVYDEFTDSDVLVYQFVPAVAAAGYLKADIPPVNQSGNAKSAASHDESDDVLEFILAAITGHESVESSEGHFHMTFKESYEQQAEALGVFLEELYDTCRDMGIDDILPDPFESDLKIIRVNSSKEIMSPRTFSMYPYNAPMIQCNPSNIYLPLSVYTKRDFTEAFMRYVFMSRYPDMNPNATWLVGAVSIWMRTLIDDSGNINIEHASYYVPEEFKNNRTALFQGWPTNASGTRGAYWESMTAMIKYLDQTYNITAGDQVLASMVEEVHKGEHGYNTISNSIHAEPYIWWPAFLKSYLMNEVYTLDNYFSFLHIDVLSYAFQITPDDTLMTYDAQFADLSAQVHYISIPDTVTEKIDTLQFASESQEYDESDIAIQVYRWKDDRLQLLGEGPEVILSNLADASESQELFAMVINSSLKLPYWDTENISLTIHASMKSSTSEELLPTYVDFNLGVHAFFEDSNGYSSERFFVPPLLLKGYGSFKRNVFSGSWDYTHLVGIEDREYHQKGNARITLDKNPLRIVSFEYENEITITYDGQQRTSVTLKGQNIRLRMDEFGEMFAEVSGEETGDHITEFKYKSESVDGDYFEKMTDYDCLPYKPRLSNVVYESMLEIRLLTD